MATTKSILVRELKPALVVYLEHLERERHEVFLRYWQEIRTIYTKGWFVQLFNPRLVEFFKNNPTPTRPAVEHALTFILHEHAWKILYGTNNLRGEIDGVRHYLETCAGCMDQDNGRVLVDLDDLKSWNIGQDWSAVL
jgi:hypothetical protein